MRTTLGPSGHQQKRWFPIDLIAINYAFHDGRIESDAGYVKSLAEQYPRPRTYHQKWLERPADSGARPVHGHQGMVVVVDQVERHSRFSAFRRALVS